MGRPKNFAIRLTKRWSQQYQASAHRDITPMYELMRELVTWKPDDAAAIIRGDYRMANLIFSHNGCRVKALVDWELAMTGHPLTDLAYACAGWRCGPATPGFEGVCGLDLEGLGIPEESRALEIYRKTCGCGKPEN